MEAGLIFVSHWSQPVEHGVSNPLIMAKPRPSEATAHEFPQTPVPWLNPPWYQESQHSHSSAGSSSMWWFSILISTRRFHEKKVLFVVHALFSGYSQIRVERRDFVFLTPGKLYQHS
jgi:hypothetical protein